MTKEEGLKENTYYNESYYRGKNSNYIFWYSNLKFRIFWQRRLKILSKITNGEKLKLLDIGCAFGFFLKFTEDEHEVYGMDICAYAIMKAKTILSEPSRVKVCDIRKGIPFKERFDLITAFDIMEHIHEPLSALSFIKKSLSEGGILYLEVPVDKTLIHRDAAHYYRSTQEWLNLLADGGFKPLFIQTFYTIGIRALMIPVNGMGNYCSIVAKI